MGEGAISRLAGAVALSALLAACASQKPAAPIVAGTMKPYQVRGEWYRPKADDDYDETGMASWYAEGRMTASGERFDPSGLSAAHRTLPLPSIVEVTNLENGRKVRVRLNDRGPFAHGRLIDLSRGAAAQLGFLDKGMARVRVRYIGPAPLKGVDGVRVADTRPQERRRPDPPAVSDGVYQVQVAAFLDSDNAERARARLGDARITPTERDGATFYRLILGPVASAREAADLQARAAAAGFPDARVSGPL